MILQETTSPRDQACETKQKCFRSGASCSGQISETALKLNENSMLDMRFSVAPMMDWTDRHCRVFHRLLSRRARLYTEMLTSGAIIHGDRARLLGFDAS